MGKSVAPLVRIRAEKRLCKQKLGAHALHISEELQSHFGFAVKWKVANHIPYKNQIEGGTFDHLLHRIHLEELGIISSTGLCAQSLN